MDDLLGEFLTETSESLDVVDVELVKFEKEPNNTAILDNIFRLVHTIKGTCGFLGLPRLEALAHAAETLMGKFRDGVPVTQDAVSLILITIDRIKDILVELENEGSEPEGDDAEIISKLDVMSLGEEAVAAQADAAPASDSADEPAPEPESGGDGDELKIVVRETKPGEVTLDDLERAFQEAEGPELEVTDPDSFGDAVAEPEKPADAEPDTSSTPAAPAAKAKGKEGGRKEKAVKTQTIRVNVDTLEMLMTMVSELVLTRNQLLEMV
ncbi:MAG: Hpt domain-containing protein, partial [Alphaproteobacteria bacterium]